MLTIKFIKMQGIVTHINKLRNVGYMKPSSTASFKSSTEFQFHENFMRVITTLVSKVQI